MDQTALVEIQIRDGQRLLDRLAIAGIEVTAACWIKESESGLWYLYLITPLVSEDGATRPAYRRVNIVVRDLQSEAALDSQIEAFEIDPLEIKVIAPSHPVAQAVASIQGQGGARPKWFRGERLGNLGVEGSYIYPPKRESVKATRPQR